MTRVIVPSSNQNSSSRLMTFVEGEGLHSSSGPELAELNDIEVFSDGVDIAVSGDNERGCDGAGSIQNMSHSDESLRRTVGMVTSSVVILMLSAFSSTVMVESREL